MEAAVTLSAESRTETGKGPAGRLRAAGKLPAVIYGNGEPAVGITLAPKELLAVLKGVKGKNTLVSVNIAGGASVHALVQDYTYHPVTRSLLHADLIKVDLTKTITVRVPFKTEGKAKGMRAGALVQTIFREVPVKCLPSAIPSAIVADVTEVTLHEPLKAKDVKLPAGVALAMSPEQTLVALHMEEKEEVVAEAAKAGAAPAAAGKPAAAAAAKPAEKKK